MDKEQLLKKIDEIYENCKQSNWDSCNAEAISEETINHGQRFVNKLDKYHVSLVNLAVTPLTDDNLSFKWSYPDKTTFNIDFDKKTDTLLWCCYKDDNNTWFGSVSHFEEILAKLSKFIDFHEKKTNEVKKL